MIKKLDNLDGYNIPMRGNPRLHEEVAWYGTDDSRVLGIVVRDRIDNDFGFVVLGRGLPDRAVLDGRPIPAAAYRCIDMAVSMPAIETATAELHKAMLKITPS